MSDIKRKIEDFNKRWDIISQEDYLKEFNKFKTRVLNVIKDVDDRVEDEGIIKFCNLIGNPIKWIHTSQMKYSTNIIDAFNQEENEIEFYRLIEYLFLLKFKTPNPYIDNITSFKENYFYLIKEVISYSNVNMSIIINADEVILIPRGEELLDEILVDEVLTFLHRQDNHHFIRALKFYEKSDGVKSAESLRRSLEEFLRYKLKNDKGLNTNISELQKKLKNDGRDPQIRNVIFAIFNFLDQYFNENSKHQDGDIDEVENEYLIYQVGVLMRYINKALKVN